jgi:hypothetical protein
MPRKLPSFFAAWVALEAIALALFAAFPMEPPWMADPRVTRVFAQYVDAGIDPNPVAAMPSLHVAFPALIGFWFIAQGRRRIGAAMLVYATAIWFEVVASGEHYIIDGAVGVAAALGALALVNAAAYLVRLAREAWKAPDGRRRLRQAESGQSLIEFSLLFPVVLVFIAAIVIFGLALNARASLQQGVREGARQAAVGASIPDVQSMTEGNAPEWLDAAEVVVCLPSGSNGEVWATPCACNSSTRTMATTASSTSWCR